MLTHPPQTASGCSIMSQVKFLQGRPAVSKAIPGRFGGFCFHNPASQRSSQQSFLIEQGMCPCYLGSGTFCFNNGGQKQRFF